MEQQINVFVSPFSTINSNNNNKKKKKKKKKKQLANPGYNFLNFILLPDCWLTGQSFF